MAVGRRGGGGGGGSEQDEIDRLRLQPFNKLRCFHGLRSIKMCYEDRNSSKILTKILNSGELKHLTAGR